MNRIDGRSNECLRPVSITRHFTRNAQGALLIEVGNTKVICTAMVEDKVPPFLRGEKKGWVTAEYEMLPSSTGSRKGRDRSRGKIDGRTVEIQRLIGRSLRSVIDMEKLGERTIWIDWLMEEEIIAEWPINGYVAATSVGINQNEPIMDLCYEEDSTAEVDMNIVMTDKGEIVEIQGTGEERPFTRDEFQKLLALGEDGVYQLINIQKEALGTL